MSSSGADQKAQLSYYLREGFWRHVERQCDEVLSRRGNDSYMQFWGAFAKAMQGSIAEATRDLESLRRKRDVEFAVIAALIHVRQMVKILDREEIASLKAALPSAEDMSGEGSKLLAATFYWHIGNHGEARRLVAGIMAPEGEHQTVLQIQAQALRGWIDVTTPGTTRREKEQRRNAIHFFEASSNQRDLETLMGTAKYYETHRQHNDALDRLNQAIAQHAWFMPALLEKARVLVATDDWEQAQETAQRVLAQEPQNIEALRICGLFTITQQAQVSNVASRLNEIVQSLEQLEPQNAALFYRVARPFVRLSRRNREILQPFVGILERARRLEPESSLYATEAAYQQSLLGHFGEAMDTYRVAAKLDESNTSALRGVIYCQLMTGQMEDAEQQLEFLSVVAESIGSTAEMAFLQAVLAWRKRRDVDAQSSHLDQALDLHLAKVRETAHDQSHDVHDRYVALNPDFMLQIAKEFLQHMPVVTLGQGGDTSAPETAILPAQKGIGVLERVTLQVPGFLEAHVVMAKARCALNDVDAASRTLTHCLRLDPSYSEAHLLMAQIGLAQENFRSANQSLEQALSYDFAIRNSPIYHLVKAKILEQQGSLEEALQVLESCMKLPDVRGGGSSVALSDRVSIFIEMADVLTRLDRLTEAASIIREAQDTFRGTTEEVRILVANSELAIKRNDVDAAIRMLNNVPQESPAYMRAQMVKANIYLQHHRDRRKYTECYQDLVRLNPTGSTYVALGEAHMRIQAPEAAVEAFEQALKRNPRDSALASKIGRALVSTHDFLRAIDYYETALRNAPDRVQLRHELADLYTKLRKYDQASRVLNAAIDQDSESLEDHTTMVNNVKNLLLLVKVNKGNGNDEGVADSLERARRTQRNILDKMRGHGEQPELVRGQKVIAANICFELGKHQEAEGEDDRAVAFFNEALGYDEVHEKSMLALAKLHMRRSELEQCQHQCVTLMRIDTGNEDASMMLADLMFTKSEYTTATFHYQQLLERAPNNYIALSKLIALLRRAGKLDEGQTFLRAAERGDPRAVQHAGLHYCKGLYNRYTNDVHEAVKSFNQARRDSEWGEKAITNMVEIYLNPDNENMWEDTEGNSDSSEAARVAERLLKELPEPKTLKHQVAESYVLMATKARANIDRAVQNFIDMLEVERDYVPALLGMATAFMLQRQSPKARNQLKRIAKMPYNADMAEEFERSYLLLADIYIGRGKFDLAQDLCRRCLSYNRSCAKAWEAMGLIMEKEQSYRDAADHYEQAWKYEAEASASVGYKLAFNYLKAQRYVEAIDVCHKVISLYPDYPKIQRDILDKARQNLRL